MHQFAIRIPFMYIHRLPEVNALVSLSLDQTPLPTEFLRLTSVNLSLSNASDRSSPSTSGSERRLRCRCEGFVVRTND